MLGFQTAERLVTACVERPPTHGASGEIVILNVGLVLVNEGRRPLGYEILKVVSEVEACSAVAMPAAEAWGEVPPHASHVIDLGLALNRPLRAGEVLRGTLQTSLRFGAHARLHDALDLDFAVSFKALSPGEVAAFGWRAV